MLKSRKYPNILITGTPGVGKTTFAEILCSNLNDMLKERSSGVDFKHVNLGEVIKREHLYTEWDNELNCSIFDSDLVRGRAEEIVSENSQGGVVLEFHSPSVCEIDWFDYLVLLRTTTETLFDRLTARGYSEAKREQNVQSEIFGIVEEELQELLSDHEGETPLYRSAEELMTVSEVVLPVAVSVGNNNLGELDENVSIICGLVESSWVDGSNHQP